MIFLLILLAQQVLQQILVIIGYIPIKGIADNWAMAIEDVGQEVAVEAAGPP